MPHRRPGSTVGHYGDPGSVSDDEFPFERTFEPLPEIILEPGCQYGYRQRHVPVDFGTDGDRVSLRAPRLDLVSQRQDDGGSLHQLRADAADSRERPDVSVPVAGAPGDGGQQRQLGVREPDEFRGQDNVSDVLVAVHDVESAADIEDTRRVAHRGREDGRPAWLDGTVKRRGKALAPCRGLATPATEAR